MEHCYFIQKDGVKQGPLKLAELKLMTIYFDELIWRSDDDQWKKASEFEELQEIFIIKPPRTPIEEKKKDFNNNFFTTIIPYSIGIYVVLSLLITVISFSIANKSWDDVKNKYINNKEEIGKNRTNIERDNLESSYEELKKLRLEFTEASQILDGSKKNTGEPTTVGDQWSKVEFLRNKIRSLAADSSYRQIVISSINQGSISNYVEPIYKIPQNIISTEDAYALGQSFLFRPYYAYFSKIYLTKAEQDNAGKLFRNIALSSFLSLLIVVIAILVVYYFIKVQMVRKE